MACGHILFLGVVPSGDRCPVDLYGFGCWGQARSAWSGVLHHPGLRVRSYTVCWRGGWSIDCGPTGKNASVLSNVWLEFHISRKGWYNENSFSGKCWTEIVRWLFLSCVVIYKWYESCRFLGFERFLSRNLAWNRHCVRSWIPVAGWARILCRWLLPASCRVRNLFLSRILRSGTGCLVCFASWPLTRNRCPRLRHPERWAPSYGSWIGGLFCCISDWHRWSRRLVRIASFLVVSRCRRYGRSGD